MIDEQATKERLSQIIEELNTLGRKDYKQRKKLRKEHLNLQQMLWRAQK